ncbi:MAG: hypothetical protein QXM92_01825 [Candidatus Anstonellales archaeon]
MSYTYIYRSRGNDPDNVTIELNQSTNKLQLKDLGITTAKIADQAVDANKIARPAIIPDHLFTLSVFQKHLGILVPFYGFMNMRSSQQLGLWVDVRYGYVNTNTGAWPADTNIRFWPFILRNTVQVNAIRVNVSTAASAGNAMRFNIYDGNGDTSYFTSPDDPYFYWPRTKLLTNDWLIDTTTTGVKSITLSPALTLEKGKMYWFAMQNNNTGTTKPSLSACAATNQFILGLTTTFTDVSCGLMLTGIVYGSLPNDISPYYANMATTSLIAPSVQIQYEYVSS